MFRQYLMFIINGGLLGFAAWGMHALLFRAIGDASPIMYAVTTAIIYPPFVLLNFFIQQNFIFAQSGRFLRFAAANALVMVIVVALSPLIRSLLDELFGPPMGDYGGFLAAALMGVSVSYGLVKLFVFATSGDH